MSGKEILINKLEATLIEKMKEEMIFKNLDNDSVNLIFTLWDCVAMIEKYHFQSFTMEYVNNEKILSFIGDDMPAWKKGYYKSLVETDIICDNKFYEGGDVNKNYGVGEDGWFSRDELINLRYQLYKKLYELHLPMMESITMNNQLYKVLLDCTSMLMPYLDAYQNNFNIRNDLIYLNNQDAIKWKKLYYPSFVESSLIADFSIFDQVYLRENYGIGNDACASGSELQHFVSECYRFVLLPLYATAIYHRVKNN